MTHHPTSIVCAPRIWQLESVCFDRRLVRWEMSCPLFSFGFSCLFCWMLFVWVDLRIFDDIWCPLTSGQLEKTGRKRKMFICACLFYSCKHIWPKGIFFLQIILILAHLSYPVIQKISWGQETEALEQCDIAGCGALEGPLRHLTFSQSYTQKRRSNQKHQASWSSFNSQSKIYSSISCLADPHGERGVVSAVLFH